MAKHEPRVLVEEESAMKNNKVRVARGFTLFELMIVVGILVLLVGILLPTLGKVKDKARATATLSLMSNLQSDIHAYMTQFGAYPGPMTAAITTANAQKISGTQNMLLGLTFAMGTVNAPPAAWPGITPSATPNGPIDYANLSPLGTYSQLQPYYSPGKGEVGAVQGALGTNAMPTFPVVFDKFTDGLPILYFRRTAGVNSPAVANDASTPAAFYLNENTEYTRASALQSTSGATYNETLGTFGIPELTKAVGGGGGSANADFVLISAGIDRYYGTYKGRNDDLVVPQ